MKAKLTSPTKKVSLNLLSLLLILLGTTATLAAAPPSTLRLEVSGNNMQNEAAVYFDPAGSFYYNPLLDAPSLGTAPGYVNIVTRFDSIDYQVKALPLLGQSLNIPVKITTGTTGSYQIYLQDLQNIPSGACVFLHDNLTNTNQNMRISGYTCTISDTETVARFDLTIIISVMNTVTGSAINPACISSADGQVTAKINSSAACNYFWKDSMNNIVKTSLGKSIADTLFFANAGFYHVDVNPAGTCSNGTYTVMLNSRYSSHASFTADTSASKGEAVQFLNTSGNAATYWWDFGDGMGGPDTNGTETYSTPGTYTVTLFAYGSVCPDTSVHKQKITISDNQVELLSFKAVKKSGETIALEWKTSFEMNNDYFTIEKSEDGAHFTAFTIMKSAGNSLVTQTYSVSDHKSGNAVFYRLKQTSLNGQSNYFPAVLVETVAWRDPINLFPNPNPGNRLAVSFSSRQATNLLITDAYGRTHYAQDIPGSDMDEKLLNLDLSLEPGVYTVQLITGSERTVKTLVVTKN